MLRQPSPKSVSRLHSRGYRTVPWILLLAGLLILAGCGGGSSSSGSSSSKGALAGNWQFTVANPGDNSFQGGIRGGFLLQKDGAVSGAVTYSVAVQETPGGPFVLCNSGSAPVTGTISGQDVKLTAVAGVQTFTLTGSLSKDGSTMTGTYASTDGEGCGTAQTDLQWSAISVKPLSGPVQGSFHSVSNNTLPPIHSFANQDFTVTGLLTQGENIGASNATVTGTLIFKGYPCLDPDFPLIDPLTATVSVNGQISGTSVILNVFAANGLHSGQIGATPGSPNPSPVTFESVQGGAWVLHGVNGYGVSTKYCIGGNTPGDNGNICLAMGSASSCTQPILLSPAVVTFPSQAVGSFPSSQTITVTNNDPAGGTLSNLTISKLSFDLGPFGGPSDFTGLPNFSQLDTCASAPDTPFSLAPHQSCTVTVSFAPQQSCPWLPFGSPISQSGAPPTLCPFPLSARVTVNSPDSADGNTAFAVPVTGFGVTSIVPSTAELDFGSEAVGQQSLPQSLTFTNQGKLPVQILPSLGSTCVNPDVGVLVLPRPLAPGKVNGFQVLTSSITADASDPLLPTIDYLCDSDLVSKLPNLQISADNCSGRTLAPQESCSLDVTFVPQPGTSFIPPLDYFLELDTLQCTADVTANCEIDSGRFPVELKANAPSPLRMNPGAGLEFGEEPLGLLSFPPLTLKLFNDPDDPNAGPGTFTGNIVKGDYIETNDCGAVLDPGETCTLSISFKPKILGFDPGTITIGYGIGQIQTIYMRGTGIEPLP